MAILAGHTMNIMLAGGTPETGIHPRYLELAVRNLRMAFGARIPRTQRVGAVAIQAAQPRMHAARGFIIAGAHVMGRPGRMTLITIPEAKIPGDFHWGFAIVEFRMRQLAQGEEAFFTPIIKPNERRTFLRNRGTLGGITRQRGRRRLRRVNLVAGKAGHGIMPRHFGGFHFPRSLVVQRRHEVADRTREEHGVTAQTVVDRRFHLVVRRVQEGLPIIHGMPVGGPLLEFGRMTGLTLLVDGQNLAFA